VLRRINKMYTYIPFSNIKAKFKVPKRIRYIVNIYSWRWTGKTIMTDVYRKGKRTTVTLNKFLQDMGTKYKIKISPKNKNILRETLKR
jgi:hypothetical protein